MTFVVCENNGIYTAWKDNKRCMNPNRCIKAEYLVTESVSRLTLQRFQCDLPGSLSDKKP
jgi:hypothetical protein